MSTLGTHHHDGVLTLTLQRGRANPINLAMMADLRAALQDATQRDEVRGLLLTGQPGFFSSGLDLIELLAQDRDGVAHFWTQFMELARDLAAFPKPVVTAVSGHSPAGGCVLAICTDYRLMAEGEFRIGLNEVPVGIIVPELIYHLYAFWIGSRRAYQFLLEGKLLTPQEAQACGLVDAVVPPDELLTRAEAQLRTCMAYDAATWQASKANMRADLLAQMPADPAAVIAPLLAHWWQPRTQAILHKVVERLTQKR